MKLRVTIRKAVFLQHLKIGEDNKTAVYNIFENTDLRKYTFFIIDPRTHSEHFIL